MEVLEAPPKVHDVLIIDQNVEEVLEHWRESGLNLRTDLNPTPHSFDSINLTMQRIMREKPSAIIVGFRLGHVMFNGSNVVEIAHELPHPPIIVANDESDANFDDVRMLIDGFASRNPQKLREVIDRLISF